MSLPFHTTPRCRLGAPLLAVVCLLSACVSRPAGPALPASYVVLLPDLDGAVGRLSVTGGQGAQTTLEQAGQGTALDGTGQAFAVSDATLQRVFGAALAARPAYPDRFYLYFETGSAQLTPQSLALLPTILEKALARDNADVSVLGHSDTQGEAQANRVLAYQRAVFIANLLRERGMQPASLMIDSHGEGNLLVPTPDDTPEPRNRRVEITIR